MECDFELSRTHVQVARIIAILRWLSPLRYGISLDRLRDAIQGDWSSRTIRRDLELLENLGLVERVKVEAGVFWRPTKTDVDLDRFLILVGGKHANNSDGRSSMQGNA